MSSTDAAAASVPARVATMFTTRAHAPCAVHDIALCSSVWKPFFASSARSHARARALGSLPSARASASPLMAFSVSRARIAENASSGASMPRGSGAE